MELSVSNHFTKKEDTFLSRNRNKIPAKRMAKILGRSECAARQRMKRIGCLPDKEAIEKFRKESHFKKGQKVWNKGIKGLQIGGKETQFKKGTRPPNYKPVGSERIDSKDGYVYIKVAEGMHQFKLKHRVIYEQNFGPIPKGYNVEFKDRNRQNFSPDNLLLRTRKENMKLNTVHNYPKEIANLIQLRGALNRQINKKLKTA